MSLRLGDSSASDWVTRFHFAVIRTAECFGEENMSLFLDFFVQDASELCR